MDILLDEHGRPLPPERAAMVRDAYYALKKLTDHERGLALCWFCRGCNRYVGPGDTCHCMNDE